MRIRQIGDPILQQVSQQIAVSQIQSAETAELIARMKSILDGIKAISDENGNALSAPQVGSLRRLILLRIEGRFRVMINPVIKPLSTNTFEFEEECFSLYDQRATLTRFYEVEISYFDDMATPRKEILCGENAGLVQHEVDHLDGILFLDRLKEAGRHARSVDELMRQEPERLEQVRAMMTYMVGDESR